MSRPEQWGVREIRPGDQLRVKHLFFYHHGLYEGDGQVIHFAGPDSDSLTDADSVTVRRDTLEHFSMGRDLEVRDYSLTERLRRYPARKILKIARSHLGEAGYDILYNNCEHFVNLCTFGKAVSNQIDDMRKLIPDRTEAR